jgi:hypothetical protein
MHTKSNCSPPVVVIFADVTLRHERTAVYHSQCTFIGKPPAAAEEIIHNTYVYLTYMYVI